jgi:hypothetical protein
MLQSELNNLYPKLFLDNNYAYGDNWVVAKYCGFDNIQSIPKAEWQHGHIIPERNIHPELIIGSDGLSKNNKDKTYLVARIDQKVALNNFGYSDVIPIGLPIIYCEKPKIERLKKSLLVMPIHSLKDSVDDFHEETYVDYIESIAFNFSTVKVCLHKSCFDKKNWVNSFEKKGFEVVLGADPNDSNSLDRLAYLFSKFEYVTTNEFGSQIAYSAFFGAKPSISGPKVKWNPKQYENLTFYKNAPEVLTILTEWTENEHLKNQYPFLYIEPFNAIEQENWAKFQLGFSNKKKPNEILKIFGWKKNTIFKFLFKS